MERKHDMYSKTCVLCKHLNIQSVVDDDPKCTAFPDGIPEKIYSGRDPHTLPYTGDNGIQFEIDDDPQLDLTKRMD